MNRSLKHCPICSGSIFVSKYSCSHCQTDISGKFELSSDLWQLDPELMDFIKVFIYAEGSIKQSEKLLNCSYPKIKNLLKKTKLALGIKEDVKEEDEESVISRLEKGEIDVEEALNILKNKES